MDGAYRLYPDAKAASPVEQQEAILRGCVGAGMGCTLVVPRHPWQGNEIEKRTALFKAGEAVTDPDDWYFVIDGDMVLRDAIDWKARLADLGEDVASVLVFEPSDDGQVQCSNKQLFRAARGLHLESNHFTYKTGDGRYFRCGELVTAEPAAAMLSVRVEHRQRQRASHRLQTQREYYARRASVRAERME